MKLNNFKVWDKITKEQYDVIDIDFRTPPTIRIGYFNNPSWGSRIRTIEDVEFIGNSEILNQEAK